MLNPNNYDYLWTDYEVNYFFVSCYLFKKFRKTDFVLIYDWQAKGLKFFLAKKEREKFSYFGIKFYDKLFFSWKKKIIQNIKIGEKLIKATNKEKNFISNMKDKEIKEKIFERVNLFQKLGENYFYTEFFFLDKVEKLTKKELLKYKNISNNLKRIGKLKFDARKILNQYYNYKKIFKPYVEEIGRRKKRNDLPWLSYQEIFKIINKKSVPISKRGKINWVLDKYNGWRLITGNKAKNIIAQFDQQFFSINDIKFVKGIIASKGVYQGRIKIIKTIFSDNVKKEIKKVKKGDVLIANTTGPEIIIACQNAGAIITDEGGLTSHAAIISRELNKPCIIGTKIATKVLKDGDLVEIDANKGVVRILKRKK